MKFTSFEISLIYLVLGVVKQAPIQDIEKILGLRITFKPTEKEDKLNDDSDPQAHKVERKVEISDEDKTYIYNIMSNPEIGLPVLEETLQLIKKLKPE